MQRTHKASVDGGAILNLQIENIAALHLDAFIAERIQLVPHLQFYSPVFLIKRKTGKCWPLNFKALNKHIKCVLFAWSLCKPSDILCISTTGYFQSIYPMFIFTYSLIYTYSLFQQFLRFFWWQIIIYNFWLFLLVTQQHWEPLSKSLFHFLCYSVRVVFGCFIAWTTYSWHWLNSIPLKLSNILFPTLQNYA